MIRFLFSLCLGVLSLHAADKLPKPNIIFFMADDMGMGDTSAYQDFTGNADAVQLHTPAMERLGRMGVCFTDAHTPSSRCTPTRYGLLTGRYPWRSRMKWWVLLGAQGDPLIEADRPTVASMLRGAGYRTGMVGKWHVGLRYRQSNGKPAAGWADADLSQPLHTTPLDHGFDFARYTSRSHGTSGPAAKRNRHNQTVGPGHLHGRIAIGATKNGKQLVTEGGNAYVLNKLGSRHSDHALEFLDAHVRGKDTQRQPFFLYYPANSNHGPYTPDKVIGAKAVAGAARTKSGAPMDARHDYIYENDVALGRLMDWLAATPDPRRPGQKMLGNTLVIFTSDNGPETTWRERIKRFGHHSNGIYREGKRSVYEGGHRVPFIIRWPAVVKAGSKWSQPVCQTDLLATFAQMTGQSLPANAGEDSLSFYAVLKGARENSVAPRVAMVHHGMQGRFALRARQWKLVMEDARRGKRELYDLSKDPSEATNVIARHPDVAARLVAKLTSIVRNGRSSIGPVQKNDTPPWKELIWMRE